jgi:hypothetical protein
MTERSDKINKINQQIVALMLERKQAERHGAWAQEEAIYKQIEALEKQIKKIEAE